MPTQPPEFSDFAARRGEPFRVSGPGTESVVVVELIEATATPGRGAPGPERPFSLIFRGPRAPLLSQRIHAFEHDALGAFELFIVPIGPDSSGHRYQAIFN